MAQVTTLTLKLNNLIEEHKKDQLGTQHKILNWKIGGPMTYGYVRVSTRKQIEDGHSIEAQTMKIQRYCREKGLTEPRIMDDNGMSGKDMETRKNFIEMVRIVKNGDTIVSYSLSRLGRDALQILQFIDEMERRGVRVIALDKEIDLTTSEGRLMLTIMAGVNQFEREQISERTSAVMQHMKEQGKLQTKGAFGYKAIGNKLVEEPEEMKVIEFITVLLFEHRGLRDAEITRRVQEKVDLGQLSMRKDKKRDGKKVYQSTISRIITRNNLRELVREAREKTIKKQTI